MRLPSPREPRSAFSLVELLIAVSVLVVLAGLLVSFSQRAAEAARQTQCISNLKQWGTVIHQYTSDFQGRFPGSYPFNDGRAWYHFSSPLVLNYLLGGASDNATVARWNQASGINGCPEHPNRYDSYAYNFHLGNLNAVGQSLFRGGRSQLQYPASFLMITDAPVDAAVSGFSTATPERIGKCHSGRFNGLYADGHVESLSNVNLLHIFPE